MQSIELNLCRNWNILFKRIFFFRLSIEDIVGNRQKQKNLFNIFFFHSKSNCSMPCIQLFGLHSMQKYAICYSFPKASVKQYFISFKIITFILKRLSVFVNYFFSESRSGHQVAESVGWDALHKSVPSGTDRRHYPLLTVCFCIWMHPRAPSLAEGRATNISNP